MSKFSILETMPEYKEVRKNQDKLPGESFYPTTFDNFLSNDELQYLKDLFNNYPVDKIDVQGYSGLGTLYIQSLYNQESIIKRVEELASAAAGEELEVLDFSGTRYSPEFGWEVKLGPHFDARPVEMYVFDLQVQSNQEWGLFFEGERFDLKDNQALLFSGTSQIHWRDPIRLKDNARVDLIFFWMQHKKPRPLSDKHIKIMEDRQKVLLSNIKIMPHLNQSDWWKPIKRSELIEKYPHYEKISIEHKNPLLHNEIYRSTLSSDEFSNLYKIIGQQSSDSFTINLPENIKYKIVDQMTHIHAGYGLTLEDVYFVKYSNNNKISKMFVNQNTNKDIVTIGIKLQSSVDFSININNDFFEIKDSKSITFSPSNQTINVDFQNFKDNDFVDMLFCNFSLKDDVNRQEIKEDKK